MTHDRPGHYNREMSGAKAFHDAIQRQEGQFMRGATYILNPPKDMTPSNGRANNERIAKGLLERNAKQSRKSK